MIKVWRVIPVSKETKEEVDKILDRNSFRSYDMFIKYLIEEYKSRGEKEWDKKK